MYYYHWKNSFLDKCIFVQAAVHTCFFNHMHISAVPVLMGLPWNQQHLPARYYRCFPSWCLWSCSWMPVSIVYLGRAMDGGCSSLTKGNAELTTKWGVEIDVVCYPSTRSWILVGFGSTQALHCDWTVGVLPIFWIMGNLRMFMDFIGQPSLKGFIFHVQMPTK